MADCLPIIENRIGDRLRVGIHLYLGIQAQAGPELEQHIAAALSSLRQAGAKAPPEGYTLSRGLYRSFRIDPTRYRPSSEALWRRFRESGDFPRVTPLVDLTNLLSLTRQVCYGLYDLDRIEGAIQIALGGEADSYPGIRKEPLHLAGKIVLRDSRGAFGNPSSDSLRTAVGPNSQNVLQVLFFHSQDPRQEEVQEETGRLFARFFAMHQRRSQWA